MSYPNIDPELLRKVVRPRSVMPPASPAPAGGVNRSLFDTAMASPPVSSDTSNMLGQRLEELPPPAINTDTAMDYQPAPATPATPAPPVRTMHGEKHKGVLARLGDAGKLALANFNRYYQPTGDGRTDFLRAAGGAIGGGVAGLANPQAAHDLQYEQEMDRYEEGQQRAVKSKLAGLPLDRLRFDQDKFAYDRDEDQRRREAGERDAATKAEQVKNNNAESIVRLSETYGLAPPPESVKGTAYEMFGGVKPPAKAERERMPTPHFDPVTGEALYVDVVDGKPMLKKMPGESRNVKPEKPARITSMDRYVAEQNAQARLNQEYSSDHIASIISDYEGGLYQKYAQEAGINWGDEQAAKGEGAAPDESQYEGKSFAEIMAAEQSKGSKTKGALIRAVRARARKEAEARVRQDLEKRKHEYLMEELANAEDELNNKGLIRR